MYHSDSDESIRRYNLDQQFSSQQFMPQSTLSLNQLPNSRRRSNPDIYPGARRFSTSYSDEDILSNDQLDQIHFDPRYRDYRSASSINNSNYRIRSNSLHSMGSVSGGCLTPQYQPYRRVSSVSPPLNHLTIPVPLAPQRRWNTNPSIFIEEYRDEENPKSLSDAKKNSRDSLCNTSNDSLQPALSENDIKSFGDLSKIPFIDDDSNESAPCRMFDDDDVIEKIEAIRPCRKTVSFDVIQKFGNNFPQKSLKSNFYSTHKNPQLFHAAPQHSCNRTMIRDDVRRTRDGYLPRSKSQPRPFSSSSDHCSLVDKLIKIRMEEDVKSENNENCPLNQHQCHQCSKVKWSNESKVSGESDTDSSKAFRSGKVKALTTYFNTLPFMTEECNCIKIHQSTPNLSSSTRQHRQQENRLSCEELTMIKEQLEEWSEFGLEKDDNNSVCSFMKRAESAPILCFDNEIYDDCKEYRETLNRLNKVRMKRLKENECHCSQRCVHHTCPAASLRPLSPLHQPQTRLSPLKSEKHRCRSACFNPKRKPKKASKLKLIRDDDNESLVI